MIRYLYNPDKNLLIEAIPLFYREDFSDAASNDMYQIHLSLSNNEPVAYVCFIDDEKDGNLVSAFGLNYAVENNGIVELE